MVSWNRLSPESWAQSLGMIPVPMFGAARAKNQDGQHSILLDGEKASFALSVGDSDSLLHSSGPISWAWSSNVAHSIVIDPDRRFAISRRWDDPSSIERFSLPSESDAQTIVDSFDTAAPLLGQTVIERAINSFRAVRTAVFEAGGSDDDTMRVFIALLEAIRLPLATSVLDTTISHDWQHAIALLSGHNTEVLMRLDRLFRPDQINDIAMSLLHGEKSGEYLLDTDLLIRHASGSVFQEAHLQISRPQYKSLFLTGGIRPEIATGVPKRDAHFTPPSLARILIEEASRGKGIGLLSNKLEILDPACGSGVFLIEALREFQDKKISLRLRGMDTSPAAQLMTDYNLRRISGDIDASASPEIDVADALRIDSWGSPDVIVMNPPFSSWEMMDQDEQTTVKNVLGDLYFGRADKAAAFIVRAIRSLKPGAVLATLAPQSFLTSRFASKIREWISNDATLAVKMIGLFTGFSFFRGAVVEPCFLIITKAVNTAGAATTFVLAADKAADHAIRWIRLRRELNVGGKSPWADIRVYDAPLSRDRWKPGAVELDDLKQRLRSSNNPPIGQLFDVREGIRTGDNHVFILKSLQLEELRIPKDSRAFRPDASNSTIHVGQLTQSRYVFYPYDENGNDLFSSENELRSELPLYYSEILKPNEESLRSRKGVPGKWWTLTRPRPTWQASVNPRIISTVFADSGSTTFDASGRFAITQGFYWQWTTGDLSDELALGYVAILNSRIFLELCRSDSRSMRGGQVDFYPNHVNAVSIPNLLNEDIPPAVVGELSACGKGIVSGRFASLERMNALTARAYQISEDDIWDGLQGLPARPIADRFLELSRRWNRDTKFISSPKVIYSHPAFQQIVSLGRDVLPSIISAMQHGMPSPWFRALEQITGMDPVKPEHRGYVDEMARDWISAISARGL